MHTCAKNLKIFILYKYKIRKIFLKKLKKVLDRYIKKSKLIVNKSERVCEAVSSDNYLKNA